MNHGVQLVSICEALDVLGDEFDPQVDWFCGPGTARNTEQQAQMISHLHALEKKLEDVLFEVRFVKWHLIQKVVKE